MSPLTRSAERLRALCSFLTQTARLIVGMPDYDQYLAHMLRTHPDALPLSREAFFKNRLQARYGRGASRCC
jgi:uncharacterized short protein YbdD (DUF466 family)